MAEVTSGNVCDLVAIWGKVNVSFNKPRWALPYAPSPTTAAVAQTKPLNSMQKALVGLAANLPPAPGSNLQNHLAKLRVAGPQAAPAAALASVHDARDYLKRQAGNYFQSH